MSQLVLIVKSLYNMEWDLKRVSNLIQIINDYNMANKYDLIWQTHFMLKCLNWNIIDEGIKLQWETGHWNVKSNHLWLS